MRGVSFSMVHQAHAILCCNPFRRTLLVLVAAFACADLADAQNLLYVRGGASLSTQDNLRITQFQSWGYTVTLIDDSDSQANFDTALATAEVVYVSEEVSSAEVGYKLRETTVGVVSEEQALLDELGLATASSDPGDHGTLSVIDNSHPITSAFSVGSVSFSSPDADVSGFDVTPAPDLHVLGNWSSTPAIGVIETGETLANTYNGSDIALGRRVGIPLGSNFDWGDLTADGLLLLQNAVTWATGIVQTTDPIVWYKFDETTGTTVANYGSLGSAADATVYDNASLDEAGFHGGSAVRFDGGYVTPGSVDGLNSGTGAPWSKRTIELWFRTDSVSGRQILYERGGNTRALTIYLDGDQLYFNSYNRFNDDGAGTAAPWGSPPVWLSTSGIRAGTLYHVVAVLDANTTDLSGEIRLYLNGELKSTTTGVGPVWASEQMSIGRTTATIRYHDNTTNRNGGRFTGVIDEVKVWDAAFTDQEALESYGLVGHWKLDETSGTVAADNSGMGNDGAYDSNVTLGETGIRSTAARFSLSQPDGVVIPYDESLRSTEAASVAAWVYAESVSNWRQIFSNRTPSIDNGFRLRVASNQKLRFTCSGLTTGATMDSPHDFPTGQWTQVVGVYTGTESRLYINGELVASQSASGSMSIGAGSTYIGRYDEGLPWDGLIDDVMYYNRVMTDEEIAEHYGLMARYKLDETSGTVAADSSGLGNDGAHVNAVAPGQEGVRLNSAEYATTGDQDHTTLPHTLIDGADTVSVAWWLKRDENSSGFQSVLSGANATVSSANAFLLYFPNETGFSSAVSGSIKNYTIPDTTEGRWHHFVYQINRPAGVERLYLNGELVLDKTRTPTSTPLEIDPGGLMLGQDQDSVGGGFDSDQKLEGSLDDVVIYNRMISEQEIAELYGLVGWWRMEEVSGTLASDSSGAGNHGAVVGTPAWSTDSKEGFGSIEFDGSNYVQIPSLILTDAPSGATVSGWAKLTDVESRGADLVSIGDYLFVRLDQAPSDMGTTAYMYHGSGWNGAAPGRYYEGSGWHHFSAVYDATTLEIHLYIDGVLSATEPASGPLAFSGRGSTIKIGKQGHTSNLWDFTGLVDDIRVYNRSITREEARFLYSGEYTPGPRIIRWVEVR